MRWKIRATMPDAHHQTAKQEIYNTAWTTTGSLRYPAENSKLVMLDNINSDSWLTRLTKPPPALQCRLQASPELTSRRDLEIDPNRREFIFPQSFPRHPMRASSQLCVLELRSHTAPWEPTGLDGMTATPKSRSSDKDAKPGSTKSLHRLTASDQAATYGRTPGSDDIAIEWGFCGRSCGMNWPMRLSIGNMDGPFAVYGW